MSSNSKEIAKLKKKYSKFNLRRDFLSNRSLVLNYLPASLSVWILRRVLVRSDYKLKRESIKFFHLSNRAYGAREFRKCGRLLRIAIELLGSSFPQDYANLLKNAVSVTFKNPKCRHSSSDLILATTKQIEPIVLDSTDWYQLSRGLFSLGYFRAAWLARENSVYFSILEATIKDASSTALIRGVQAHLEKGNIKDVAKSLVDIRHRLTTKHFLQFESAVLQMEKSHQPPLVFPSAENKANYEKLRKLIADKRVAIVGPGVPHDDYRDEIEEFETVVRIKFIGQEMLDDRNFHGVRTDISFIGAIAAVKLQEFDLQEKLRGLKLLLSNSTNIATIGSIPVYGIDDDDTIYRTPTTSGIRTLKEIIKFSPSGLKLFGFDFYATLTPYSKQMTKFYEDSSWRFDHQNDFVREGVYFKFARARDFSEHDPVSNFCFAQNLYRAGLFDIEPYGKSILELTPYQYVERLEEMLGDW